MNTNQIATIEKGPLAGTTHPVAHMNDKSAWLLIDEEEKRFALTSLTLGLAPEEEEQDDDEKPTNMSAHLQKYRTRYQQVLSAAGNISMNNGDDVAATLQGLDWKQVCTMADKLVPLDGQTHEDRYGRLNNGQRRMNAGNRIRAAFKRGELEFKNKQLVRVEA